VDVGHLGHTSDSERDFISRQTADNGWNGQKTNAGTRSSPGKTGTTASKSARFPKSSCE
jgi:hypothetical protein